MGDRDREPDGEHDERWRALRAALDRVEDANDESETQAQVDLSESKPLEIEVPERAERADETPTEEFGTSSPRVLTVDLADEFAGVDRERRGPVLTADDD